MIVQPRQETFDDYSDISTTIVVNSDPDSYIQVDTDEVNSAVSHTVYNMNNYLSTDMTYFSGYYCYIYKYNDGRFALSLGLTVKSGQIFYDENSITNPTQMEIYSDEVISSTYITNSTGKKLYLQYANGSINQPSVYIGSSGGLYLEWQCNVMTGLFQLPSGRTYSWGGCIPAFYGKNISISSSITGKDTTYDADYDSYELIYDLTDEYVASATPIHAEQVLLHLRTFDPTFMELEFKNAMIMYPSINNGTEVCFGGIPTLSSSDITFVCTPSVEFMDTADENGDNITVNQYKYRWSVVEYDPAGSTAAHAVSSDVVSGCVLNGFMNNNSVDSGVYLTLDEYKLYFYIDPFLQSVWTYGGKAIAQQSEILSLKLRRELSPPLVNSVSAYAHFPIMPILPDNPELAHSTSPTRELRMDPVYGYLPTKFTFIQEKNGVVLNVDIGYNNAPSQIEANWQLFGLLQTFPLPITGYPSMELLPPSTQSPNVSLGIYQIPAWYDGRVAYEDNYAQLHFYLHQGRGLPTDETEPWYLGIDDIHYDLDYGFIITGPYTLKLFFPQMKLKLSEWQRELFIPFSSGNINNYVNGRIRTISVPLYEYPPMLEMKSGNISKSGNNSKSAAAPVVKRPPHHQNRNLPKYKCIRERLWIIHKVIENLFDKQHLKPDVEDSPKSETKSEEVVNETKDEDVKSEQSEEQK